MGPKNPIPGAAFVRRQALTLQKAALHRTTAFAKEYWILKD